MSSAERSVKKEDEMDALFSDEEGSGSESDGEDGSGSYGLSVDEEKSFLWRNLPAILSVMREASGGGEVTSSWFGSPRAPSLDSPPAYDSPPGSSVTVTAAAAPSSVALAPASGADGKLSTEESRVSDRMVRLGRPLRLDRLVSDESSIEVSGAPAEGTDDEKQRMEEAWADILRQNPEARVEDGQVEGSATAPEPFDLGVMDEDDQEDDGDGERGRFSVEELGTQKDFDEAE